MSDTGDCKYKWSPESTSLLVSVWTDKQVQKQLEYSTKPQLIWDSVAKYMNKKGYHVNGKQCRSRMKQVLVCYREAKRAGTKADVEQYYDSIDKVLKLKKFEHYNNNAGVDTVDSTTNNVKSPPKDVKTNKNLQMRYKYQQPAQSVFRTEALSPIWGGGRDEDYPDSPESNETVLAQPFRVLSPVRDAATNTTQHQLGNNKKIMVNGVSEEVPIKETYRQNTYSSNNYFSEIPFQNTVQNVQNQIIQENMQQHQALLQQNLLQNQILEHNRLQMNPVMRQNIQNINQGIYNDQGIAYNQGQFGIGQNVIADNVLRMQNKCQLNSINNRAMPQEPRKNSFRQNLAANHRQFQQDIGIQNYNGNLNHLGFLSPSISPDIPPNLNDAFCQSKNDKMHDLNETFTQTGPNLMNLPNADVTTLTNNATFNDDTLSIEFLQDSPSPDHEPKKLKDFAVNTENIPSVPVRKKKAEKLERLMMEAISSQNDVVNKILAAQNDMVSRVLDLDRDRQNRLENRIDHLLDVVQTAVLNKSSESRGSDIPPPPPEPRITNLLPPPKPGVVPPKLDLVPPKPCRVPCSASNVNSQVINQNPAITRPGVISPVMSPTKRVGAICQKLGPVSTSPFVRAQQQLGFRPIQTINEARTQSSAERRIAKEFNVGMDTKTLIFETENLLESERHIQEEVENARIKAAMDQHLQSRRRLFTRCEPTAAMILSAAFLEYEIQSTEIIENARLMSLMQKERDNQRELLNRPIDQYKYNGYRPNNDVPAGNRDNDNLLAGQAERYERLRQLNARERLIGNPCDSSTPAKPARAPPKPVYESTEPRQSIQQLAQLVMNSARWRQNAAANNHMERKDLNYCPSNGVTLKPTCPAEDEVMLRNVVKGATHDNRTQHENREALDGAVKTLNWLQDRYSYGGQAPAVRNNVQEIANRLSYNAPPAPPPPKPARPMTMGFTTEFLNNENKNNNNVNRKQYSNENERRVGFVDDDENKKDVLNEADRDPFHELYIQKQFQRAHSRNLPFMMHNGKIIFPQNDIIERYMQDERNTKPNKDNDSDNDEEFLDTTASMPSSRKNSITSSTTKSVKAEGGGCIVS